MSLKNLTVESEKRVKSITEHLERLDRYSKFLFTLMDHKYKLEEDTISMSLDVLEAFAIGMDMAVDSISAELGLCRYEGRPGADAYILKPQDGQES